MRSAENLEGGVLETTVGQFQLLRPLGGGEFGYVWLAEEPREHHQVALKILQNRDWREEDIARFKREFQILAGLRHQHLARVFDFGFAPKENQYFFTSEFCRGSDFLSALEKKPYPVIEKLLVQILSALDFIHSEGIIHYDIKAQNILVDESTSLPELKLLDFGLASPSQSLPAGRVGTLAYMAPEILRRSDRLDHRVDLYSLGMLLLRLLSGQWPFDVCDLQAVIDWHFKGSIPEPLWSTAVPSHLKEITLKLIEKQPSHRFSHARVVMNFLNLATGKKYEKWERELRGPIPTEGPLVERDKILEEMKKHFRAIFFSASGKPFSSVCLISAPPGYGKSRLLEELRQYIELHEVPHAELTGHWEVPLWPQIQKIFDLGQESLRWDETSLPDEILSEDWLARKRASEIIQSARKKPGCLLIDNFHKADPATARLMGELDFRTRFERSEGRGAPLFIVIATEKKEKGAIALPPLSRNGTLLYLSQVLGDTAKLVELSEVLYAYSGGIPLLLVEGLRFLAPHFYRGESIRDLLPPPKISLLYQERLAKLTAEQRELLMVAAVFFRPVSEEELSRTLERDRESFAALSHPLERKGLVQRRYEFLQLSSQALALDLIRHLDPSHLRRTHLKIAATLDALAQAPPEEIAYHWGRSGETRRAMELYRQAAQDYSRLGQVSGASRCLQKARELVPRDSDLWREFSLGSARLLILGAQYEDAEQCLGEIQEPSPLRSELQAWIHFKRRQFPLAVRFYEEALEQTTEGVPRARLKNSLGNVALQSGKIDEAIRLFEESLKLEETLSPSQICQITNNNLGLALSLKGEVQKAERFFEERLKRVRLNQLPHEEVGLYNAMGFVLLQASRYAEAIHCLKKALELSEETGSYHAIFSILGNLLSVLLKESRFADCLPYLKKMIGYAEQFGTPRDLAYNLLREASVTLNLGIYEIATRSLERGRNIARQISDQNLGGWFQLLSGYLEKERGEKGKAKLAFDETLRTGQTIGDNSLVAWAHYATADLLCDEENLAEALKRLAAIPAVSSDEEFVVRLELLKVKLASKRHLATPDLFPTLEGRCVTGGFRELLWELYHIWGLDAWSRGSLPEALSALEKGVAVIEEICGSLPEEYQDRYRNHPARKRIKEDWLKIQGGSAMPEQTLSMLLDIIKKMVSERDPERLLAFIMDTAIELAQAEEGLLLLTNDQREFETRIARNILKENLDLIRFSRSIAGQVVQSGKPIFSDNALDDDRLKSFASVISLELKTVCCLPLKNQNRIAGVIYLATRQRQTVRREHLPVLEAFADQAAIALQNALLFQENETYRHRLEDDLSQTKRVLGEKEEHLQELEALVSKSPRKTLFPYDQIIGRSKKMEEVLKTLDKVTNAQVPLFIHGDTGTGKELLARALHQNSQRRAKPFIAINCSAFTETILESELFGYMKGSFTGADQDRKGLFEAADQGTLFLDEIAEMSLTMQAKILRVIQEQEILRVGGRSTIKINVRIVSASNKDLKKMVREGKFREDLYYRIAGMSIYLPPLRERKEDIPLLVKFFTNKIRKQNKISGRLHVSREAISRLMAYDWPGNIRELEQSLTNACLMAEEGTIRPEQLLLQKDLYESAAVPAEKGGSHLSLNPDKKLEEYEREIITKTMEVCGGNKSEAARRLGISRLTLHKKIKEI